MKPAVRWLIASQIILFGLLLLCLWLDPAGWSANEGISYFGVTHTTLLPYTLLFFGTMAALFAASLTLPSESTDARHLALSLRWLVPFMIGIVLTPYSRSANFSRWHEFFGSSLFVIQLGITYELMRRLKHDRIFVFLFALQLLGGIISFFSLFDVLRWEIQGQIVYQLAFGVAAIRGASFLTRKA